VTNVPAETEASGGQSERPVRAKNPRLRVLLDLGVLLFLALFLRCHNLPHESVWLDEYYSAAYLNAPTLTQFIRDQRPENFEMVPVYFTMEYYWAHVFGSGFLALRALSLLFGAATLCLIYALGRQLQGRAAGIVAGALYALSPHMIHHDQFIRPYPLLTLLGAASSWLLIRHLQEAPTDTDGNGLAPHTRWSRHRWLIACGLVNALLMGTHLFGVLFAAPQAIVLLGSALAAHGQEKRVALLVFAAWSAWHALVFLLIAWWVFPLPLEIFATERAVPLRQLYEKLFEADPTYIFWTRGFPDKTVEVTLPEWTRLLLERLFTMTDLLGYLYVTGVAFAAWWFVRDRFARSHAGFTVCPSRSAVDGRKLERRPQTALWPHLYLFLWLGVPACILFLFARFREPLAFQERYFIYSFPALYLLAGIAASRLRPAFLRVLYAAALCCFLSGQTLLAAFLPMRTDYMGVAQLIAREAQAHDAIVAFDWSLWRVLVFNMGAGAHPVRWNQNEGQTWQELETALDQEQRVWVVTNSDPGQEPVRKHAEEMFRRRGTPYSRTAFLGTLNLYVYISPPLTGAVPDPPSRTRTEIHGIEPAQVPPENWPGQNAGSGAAPAPSRSAT